MWAVPEGKFDAICCPPGVWNGWRRVPPAPSYPERWINVYPVNVYHPGYVSRAEADEYAAERDALIHLASDGTVRLVTE